MKSIETPENALKRMRMELTESTGKQFVDLRVYHQDDSSELKPTKKGLTLSLRAWSGSAEPIWQLGTKLSEQGLTTISRNPLFLIW